MPTCYVSQVIAGFKVTSRYYVVNTDLGMRVDIVLNTACV
jgi:hypothetical protein